MAPRITSPDRVIQSAVVEAWQASSLTKAQVSAAIPSISRAVLYRYLDGRSDVYMRERSVEAVMRLLRQHPAGPKPAAKTRRKAPQETTR